MTETTDYRLLSAQAQALLSGHRHKVANAANLAALIYESIPQINWAGFYFYEDGQLVLGPFQGRPACVTIPLGQGVCGTAAQTRTVQRVADVHLFDGHIACDVASESELVIPLVWQESLLGVLDIDSPVKGRFTAADEAGLAGLAQVYIDSLG